MLKNAFYIALFTVISWGSYQLSYPSNTPADLFYDGVFFENVLKHVDHLTQGPRAVGEYYHLDTQFYLIEQLQKMGLKVSKHRSTSYNKNNKSAAPITNIIATYPGSDPNSKDLLLMAHYDAAKFSATGAGDDASGVAVILEAVNALLKTAEKPSNDIVVLFSDAEEVGLLGAHAFINERLKKYDIGLIINLEARGTSGPGMMWPETDGGNRSMIEAFSAANVPMPVTTSLHYEIYRMLPNDTDLTPFNQLSKINGYNFAFIDDHHNYHTTLDNVWNLSFDTLAHQTIQVHSMLKHFSQADLSNLKSEGSLVYFTIPLIGLISYPTAINWVLMALSGLLFLLLLITVIKHKKSSVGQLFAGAIPLITACVLSYGWCWLVLKSINFVFPEVRDILQGFPYQGHQMMLALLISSAIITMLVYGSFKNNKLNQMLVAIFLWLAAMLPLIHFMPGAGFLLIPALLALLVLITEVYQPKLAEHMAPITAALSFVLLGTLLINLPIALGVAALPVTSLLLVFMLALFVPVISPVKNIVVGILFMALPVGYLVYTFTQKPTISIDQPHPTSLSYLYDHDSQQGYFYNYDVVNSGWNEELFSEPSSSEAIQQFRKKYKKPLKNLVTTDDGVALEPIDVAITKPLKQGENLTLEVSISAKHNTAIIELYSMQPMTIHKLSIEGRSAVLPEPLHIKGEQRFLQYYFDANKNIDLLLELDPNSTINWQIQSHSIDLIQREEFGIPPRPDHQIRKPFIKSDNSTVVQSLTLGFDQ